MKSTATTLSANTTFTAARPAPIGGGGFVINFDQSADGLQLVHGTDVTNAMIRTTSQSRWYWYHTASSLLAAEYSPIPNTAVIQQGAQNGCAGIRIAPSNKAVIYSLFSGYLYKSTDNGATVRRTSFGEIFALPNNGYARLANPLIDIHPTDPLTIIVGSNHYSTDTTKSGAFYSTNGATTAATKITGLPAALDRGGAGFPDRYLVAFDPGVPANVYVHVGGVGLYQSTTGVSGTFSAIAGSPARCGHLVVTPAGVVYCAAGGPGGGIIASDLYKRTRAGVATSITTGAQGGVWTLAVNPANALHIVATDLDCFCWATYDGGTTWEDFTPAGKIQRGSGEIQWLSDLGNTKFFPAMIKFDTAVANQLWAVHGTGIAYCAAPTAAGSNMIWHDYTRGNEEKVAESFLSVPGNATPILGNWDYSLWKMNNLVSFCNKGIVPPLAGGGNGLAIAADLDCAADDPNYWVCAVEQSSNSNAYSTDNGSTWKTIPGQTTHPQMTGAIAVNQKTNIITIGSNAGLSLFTKNGGATWSNLQVVPGTDVPNMNNAYYIRRKIVTADKTRASAFALVVPAITPGSVTRTDGGLWVTTDGGSTWTQKISGVIGASISGFTGDTRQYYNEKLRYVPGFSGEMLHTCHADLGPDWLHWITNDGASIVRLGSTVTNVVSFDFGSVLPGQTRPMVGFYGMVSGVLGAYVSYDWFATTPILVSANPLENLSSVSTIGMDRNIPRIFVGGNGWNYFDLVDVASAT